MTSQKKRALVARTRKPPKPLMREIPQSVIDEAARFAELEFDPADVAQSASYFVRAIEGCRLLTTEIATAEDWWMLDQYLGQPDRDMMEIWAGVETSSIRLWPLPTATVEAERIARELLNKKLAAGRPEECDTFTSEDGLVLAARFEIEPISIEQAAEEYLAMWDREREGQLLLFDNPPADQPSQAHVEIDNEIARRDLRLEEMAASMGVTLTDTPDGPALVAGKYVDGKLVEPAYGEL